MFNDSKNVPNVQNVPNVLQGKSFGFIPEDLKHDTAFVYEVRSKVCEYV